MKDIIKTFLESIIPAIENIDGGCRPCCTEFCDDINDKLSVFNLKLTVSDEYPIKVSIIET
jgi:hypothetical protein